MAAEAGFSVIVTQHRRIKRYFAGLSQAVILVMDEEIIEVAASRRPCFAHSLFIYIVESFSTRRLLLVPIHHLHLIAEAPSHIRGCYWRAIHLAMLFCHH